jgi:hypothetical protein
MPKASTSTADNKFVLVNAVTKVVTELDGTASAHEFKDFASAYATIGGAFQKLGGCEAIILPPTGDPINARNTPKENHAEEVLLMKESEIKTKAAFVILEPCHSKRYPGHECQAFFKPAGKTLKGKTCKFLPSEAVTPIFFLEAQPAKGQSSDQISALRRLSTEDARNAVANAAGPPWGTALMPLKSDKTWIIEGQQYMGAAEIVFFLKKGVTPKGVGKLSFADWNPDGVKKEDKVAAVIVENVKLLMGEGGSTPSTSALQGLTGPSQTSTAKDEDEPGFEDGTGEEKEQEDEEEDADEEPGDELEEDEGEEEEDGDVEDEDVAEEPEEDAEEEEGEQEYDEGENQEELTNGVAHLAVE